MSQLAEDAAHEAACADAEELTASLMRKGVPPWQLQPGESIRRVRPGDAGGSARPAQQDTALNTAEVRCDVWLPMGMQVRRLLVLSSWCRLPSPTPPGELPTGESWTDARTTRLGGQLWDLFVLQRHRAAFEPWLAAYARCLPNAVPGQYLLDIRFQARLAFSDRHSEEGEALVALNSCDTGDLRNAIETLRMPLQRPTPLTIASPSRTGDGAGTPRALLGLRSWKVGEHAVLDDSLLCDIRMDHWFRTIGSTDPDATEPWFTGRFVMSADALADALADLSAAVQDVSGWIGQAAPGSIAASP